PGVTAALIGPRTPDQLRDLLGAAELRLEPSLLDAIDEVVAPGRNVNDDDAGWTPPGLHVRQRRRTP
ncbi:MAG: aldo/keto reductase, partial [Ilumatobacter sp.]